MSWWAVYTEPRREFLARNELDAAGCDVFLPFETITKRVVDRRNRSEVKVFHEPVFPRYLFVDAEGARRPLSEVRGVVCVVSRERSVETALVVPDSWIAAARGYAAADGRVAARDVSKISNTFHARLGDRFVYRNGAFDGHVCTLASIEHLDDTGKVKAWIKLFGRLNELDVDHRHVGRVVREPTEQQATTGILAAA